MKRKINNQKIYFIENVFYILIILVVLLAAFLVCVFGASFLAKRNHWNVEAQTLEFQESNKELKNPNRGFYNIVGYVITDESQNYKKHVTERFYNDNFSLAMIQINLRKYMDTPISEEGLKNLEDLFQALKEADKQYIIRYLYDWGGLEGKREPDSIQLVMEHMKQVASVSEKYNDIIFTYQSIFVGPCAEMHTSNYVDNESMKTLIEHFSDVTPSGTFLSVRTPWQWRTVTDIVEPENISKTLLSKRLGIFNDGIMGTSYDTGTYGDKSKEVSGPYGKWTREEELAFQEVLCKYVPNGGEVIIENPVNDFENAVNSLATMHVTYLNRAYDQNVLNKWAESIVTEDGCFNGLDGLSYIERRMGYRLLIDSVMLNYDFWLDELSPTVNLKNVGFAPVYKETEAYFVMKNSDTGVSMTYPVVAQVQSLSGGNDSDRLLPVTENISIAGLEAGEYEVYFYIKDTDSSWVINFANEQLLQEFGYQIGTFVVEELQNPFTGEKMDIGMKTGEFLKRLKEKH